MPFGRRVLRSLLVPGADRRDALVQWDSADLLLSGTGGLGFITKQSKFTKSGPRLRCPGNLPCTELTVLDFGSQETFLAWKQSYCIGTGVDSKFYAHVPN